MSESDNIPEVIAQLHSMEQRIDMKIAMAASEISMRLEGAAKRMIKGERPKGEKAVSGFPPMNRTGSLRRSIAGTMMRVGFGHYQAVVGAYAEYARAVEMGDPYNPPSWQNGERFPFLKPAVDSFVTSGQVGRVVQKHLRSL